ncbi:ribosome alternative rescue factor ArfA [Pseudomonas aeruginosa]|nr:alternative ribosome rescue factor ArfA [Pseudomonas aeruginosa]OTJ19334.1 ribosome alternative rescue factor ArfA [Pseudomonas aeruginosa]
MAKKSKRPNKAKSLVAQPLFRSRQEQAKKGKGSYRRATPLFRVDTRR